MFDFALLLAIGLTSVALIVFGGGVIERAITVEDCPGPPRRRTLLAGTFPPEIGLPMMLGAFVLPFLRRRWSADARWKRALAEAHISDHAA